MEAYLQRSKAYVAAALLAFAVACGLAFAPQAYAADDAVGGGDSDLVAAQVLTAQADPLDYSGSDFTFIKEDGTAFGMFAPQDGTGLAFQNESGKIKVTFLPKNKTTYKGFYLNTAINNLPSDEKNLEKADADGNYSFDLNPSYCGKAWPVAPIKADGSTTDKQYYMAVPPLDQIPGAPTMSDLNVVNDEKMYVVVKAVLEDYAEGQDYLTYYLNGSSYKFAFSGNQDDAAASFDSKDSNVRWAAGVNEDIEFAYTAADGTAKTGNGSKPGFRLPITIPEGQTQFTVPVVAYATDFTARRFTVDLDAKTVTTGSASDTAAVAVTSSVQDVQAAADATLEYEGYVRPYAGAQNKPTDTALPLSNDFTATLAMNLGSNAVYDKAYVATYQGKPWLADDAVVNEPTDADYATVAADGALTLSIVNEYDTDPKTTQLNGNIVKVKMHVAEAAPFEEAGTWVERRFQLDFTSRTTATLAITGDALTVKPVELKNGMYKLPDLKSGPGEMFNHMEADSKFLKVEGDTATIMFVQDASTKSVAKYSRVALGKSSELVATAYQPELAEGTPIFEGKDCGSTDNGTKWGYEITISKAEAAQLLNPFGKLFIVVWNNQGASSNGNVPGWYKASNDIYLALGGLGDRVGPDFADYTAVEAAKAKVPASLDGYTADSVKALNDALAAVVEDKLETEQAEVDAMAKAIEDAIAGLVEKSASSVKLAYQTTKYTGKAIDASKAFKVTVTGSTGEVTFKYYSDAKCTKAVAAANVKNAGTYYVKATVAADDNYKAATSAAVKFTIAKAKSTIAWTTKAQTKTYNGKAQAYAGKVKKTGSSGKVTFLYYTDAKCTKAVSAKNVKNARTYYVKAQVAASANYAAAKSSAVKFTIAKAKNTLAVKAVKATQSANAKKATTIAASKAFKVTKNTSEGKVTYKKTSGNAKITIAKSGKITVKKGLKKGKTYIVKVRATSAATANYKSAYKDIVVKIKVK